MKLRKLRFKNINSLAGEWEIDFDVPALSGSIFLIHGPTGSGKTTILDAVVLALYGRTPRQDSISKHSCEVMTRGTGESFSELTFEVAHNVYTARWEQQRARKKAENPLGMQKRFLYDASGNILAEKIKDVNTKTSSILGMEFEEFTRTVMLTQGNFDAFLKADEKSRAEILEKITGTQIYQKIGEAVMDRKNAECAKRDELAAHLQGITLLSDEIRAELTQKQAELRTELASLESERKRMERAHAEQVKRNTLENSLRSAQEQKQTLDAELQAFSSSAARLASAEKARAADLLFQQEARERKLVADRKQSLLSRMEDLASLEQQIHDNARALLSAEQEYAAQEQAWDQAEQQLARAHELDIRLGDTQSRLQSLERTRCSLAKTVDSNKKTEAALLCALAESGRGVEEAEQYLALHERDASLGAVLAKLQELKGHADASFRALRLAEAEKCKAETLLKSLQQNAEPLALEALEEQIAASELKMEHAIATKNMEQHRRGLKNGEPCPLCGATQHPYAQAGHVPEPEEFRKILKRLRKEQEAVSALNRAAVICTKTREEAYNTKIELQLLFAEIGLKMPESDKITEELVKLERRKEDYAKKQSEGNDHKIRIQTLKQQLIPLRDQIKRSQDEFARISQESSRLTEEYEVLHKERAGLFNGEKADDVEAAFRKKLREAAAVLERSRKNKTELQTLHQSSLTEQQKERNFLSEAESALEKTEIKLHAFLADNAFADRSACIDARLPDAEYTLLADRKKQLTDRIRGNDAVLKNLADELAELPLPEDLRTENEWNVLLEANHAAIQGKNHLLGEVSTRLSSDAANRKEQQLRYELLLRQQETAAKWERLHALLGRGENFRRYAQSISFRTLLGRANPWMRELLPRYLLTCGEELEPCVLDLDRSAARRTVSNLSGGETFLVSLALALGLAHMNAGSLEIRSLFLDEGFGTLDETALNMAVETLRKLGSEHGRTIGIISHAPALREAVSEQIAVIPLGGGYSKLAGPGVRAVGK